MYVHSLTIENSSHPFKIWTGKGCAFSPCLPNSRGHITPRVSLLLSCPLSLELCGKSLSLGKSPMPLKEETHLFSVHGKASHSCTCREPLPSPHSWCSAAAQAVCLCSPWHAAADCCFPVPQRNAPQQSL